MDMVLSLVPSEATLQELDFFRFGASLPPLEKFGCRPVRDILGDVEPSSPTKREVTDPVSDDCLPTDGFVRGDCACCMYTIPLKSARRDEGGSIGP